MSEKTNEKHMARRRFYIPKNETIRYYGSIKGDREPFYEVEDESEWH